MRSVAPIEVPAAKSKFHIEIVVANVGWAVTLLVTLATANQNINSTFRVVLWCFVAITFGITMVFSIIPLFHKLRSLNQVRLQKKLHQRQLVALSEVLKNAKPFFASNLVHSLQYYLMSLCTEFVQNQSVHPLLKGLHEKMMILDGWHRTLMRAVSSKRISDQQRQALILDIVGFYRALSNVVFELNQLELPTTPGLKGRDNEHKILKEKFNDHLGQLENVLDDARKMSPELPYGGFNRL